MVPFVPAKPDAREATNHPVTESLIFSCSAGFESCLVVGQDCAKALWRVRREPRGGVCCTYGARVCEKSSSLSAI